MPGSRVIGTASERNHDYLRSLGAVPVVYGPGLVDRVKAAAPEGVSAALDAAGEEAPLASLELVGDRSRIGTIVAFDRVEELGFSRSAVSDPRIDWPNWFSYMNKANCRSMCSGRFR